MAVSGDDGQIVVVFKAKDQRAQSHSADGAHAIGLVGLDLDDLRAAGPFNGMVCFYPRWHCVGFVRKKARIILSADQNRGRLAGSKGH